jgi:Ca-activated chloride channel family protein
MKYILLMILMVHCSFLYSQQEKSYIQKGNQYYKSQNYTAAEENYRKSLSQKKQSLEGSFNLGDALYKQKNYTDAATKFTEIAGSASQPAVKAQAYHNLGNSLLEAKKLQESVDAYKKSLMNNPKDEQTRYNLAYAMEKLKQQKEQEKKDKDKKDKDKKDNNKDDKNKDQDKKNKDKKDQDKKDPDKNKPGDDQKNKDQQNGQQPNKISKEDAERMLQALSNEEKNTQDKLKKKKATEGIGRIIKDW